MKRKGMAEIEVVLGVAVVGILLAFCISLFDDNKYENLLISQGYNAADVRVFLEGTGYDYRDLYESQALRRHYKAFQDGETTAFISGVKAKHAHDEAQSASAAATTAIAVSAIAASSSN